MTVAPRSVSGEAPNMPDYERARAEFSWRRPGVSWRGCPAAG